MASTGQRAKMGNKQGNDYYSDTCSEENKTE